jgi:outer membrane protein W
MARFRPCDASARFLLSRNNMMQKLFAAALLTLVATPLFAQPRRVDLIFDVEGVRQNSKPQEFTPNETRFEPRFGTGGGLGLGINWFFSDRVSLEAKAAVIQSDVRVRITGSDFIAFANLGHAQVYPLTAILQWHLNEHGAIRPYIGAGAAYTILRNIEKTSGGFTGVQFKDPIGLVIDGGLEWRLSTKWGLNGDVRYVPIETSSRATFLGTRSSVELDTRPLLASAGIVYHF